VVILILSLGLGEEEGTLAATTSEVFSEVTSFFFAMILILGLEEAVLVVAFACSLTFSGK